MSNPIAELETSLGRIEVEVLLDRVPRAAEFFRRLVREGFYDGLHFHRFVEGHFVQVGCPHSRDPGHPEIGTGNAPYQERVEHAVDHLDPPSALGSLAMDTGGYGLNAASSHFVVHLCPNKWMDQSCLVFAQLTSGEDVVNALAAVEVQGERPVTPIALKSIRFRE